MARGERIDERRLTHDRVRMTITHAVVLPGEQPTRTVTVKLPAALNARLGRAAQLRGQTKSDVVREALETLLDGSRGTRPARSALELAGDLVGSIEGPGDLSTNPKYLEELGR